MEVRGGYLEFRSSGYATREKVVRAALALENSTTGFARFRRTPIVSIIDSQKGGHMPITAFNSFTDGLDPNRRSREHFITNINLEDERLWVPYANGVWFQPCCFNVTSGGFSVVLKGLPGSMVGTHYHVGTVHGYTMRGHWRYLEHDWIAKPGTYIYEPAGEAHTLVITDDSPEPMMTLFVVAGGLIYLDKAENGAIAAYEDGFTLLELTRKYYREAGLDVRQLDLLVR
jgi:quercetin dioxygenase-like cupin family protein